MEQTQRLPEYKAALDFLFGRIDYERTQSLPYQSRTFKLDRMRQLLERLGNLHQSIPVVHIAGTKGKGSTAAMCAAVLSTAGYRTGLYTSPHLDRLEERMTIDGQICSPAELVELVDPVRCVVQQMDRCAGDNPESMSPTYFEITTAMAFLHFARQKVDIAVLEVGLGGRLDSTNVCQPLVSVITSISYDHTRQLGNTLAGIAREKAGIIKPGVPVVSGVVEQEPRQQIQQIAHQNGCSIWEIGHEFKVDYQGCGSFGEDGLSQRPQTVFQNKLTYREKQGETEYRLDDLRTSLLGRHQAANAAVALAALRCLPRERFSISEESIRTGLAMAKCPVRVEIVSSCPPVVIDAAHNVASIAALVDVLDDIFSGSRRLLIFATSGDKDAAGMLRLLLARFDRIIFTRFQNNPRSVDPQKLAELAQQLTAEQTNSPGRCRWSVCPTPESAWAKVSKLAGAKDLICITGSFFIAAEVRTLFQQTLASTPA